MENKSYTSRSIMALGLSLVFGGIALVLSVAILGFGAQSASANGVQGPVAQGTQPIPVVTATSTVRATDPVPATNTRAPGVTETVVATSTAGATGTVVSTVVATGTAGATGTVVSTVVATGTAGATGTAVSTVISTVPVAATSTSAVVPTAEAFPTAGGIEATPTLVSVGMPRTGTPGADSTTLTLILLILGVMMTMIGVATLAARGYSYRR